MTKNELLKICQKYSIDTIYQDSEDWCGDREYTKTEFIKLLEDYPNNATISFDAGYNNVTIEVSWPETRPDEELIDLILKRQEIEDKKVKKDYELWKRLDKKFGSGESAS